MSRRQWEGVRGKNDQCAEFTVQEKSLPSNIELLEGVVGSQDPGDLLSKDTDHLHDRNGDSSSQLPTRQVLPQRLSVTRLKGKMSPDWLPVQMRIAPRHQAPSDRT
eukprot:2864312-Amphidinium_carterae.1